MSFALTSIPPGNCAGHKICDARHAAEVGQSPADCLRRPLAVLAGLLLASVSSQALAQQVIANGTTQTASGTINTGVLAPPAGYALYALNGGIILSSSPLTVVSGGAAADGARAEGGGNITIFSGSSVTTTGGGGAPALHATGAGSSITATNTNITTLAHGALADGTGANITLSGGTFTINGLGAGLAAIGGTLDATGITVTGSPTLRSHGAIAETGGTINLHAGTSIATGGGFNAVALGASGAGSRVNADALIPVTTAGRGAMGVYMHDGGIVSLVAGTTFQINGTSSVGVAVDNTSVPLGTIGSGLTINLNGAGVAGQAGSTGVVALNNGNISLENLTVTGPNAAAGAWATSGSTVTISGNSTININAAQNQTFYTLQTANLITADASVGAIFGATGASPIAGLFAFGGTINSAGTTINVTSGNGATGAEAANGGIVNMTNNTITTTGTNSFGIRVDGNGQVFGRDSTVTTSGGGAALFINSAPGLIDLTNSTVLATGANTTGLATLNFSAAGMNTVNLSGGSLISEQDTGIAAQGPLNLTVSNAAVVTGGGGTLLQVFDNAVGFQQTVVQLNASGGSILTGDAFVAPLSIANISLATGSQWTGAAFDVTNVSVDPTGIWTMTASSNVRQQTTNAGLIDVVAPVGDPTLLTSYKTLTTQNYVGLGGTIGLNSYLDTDGAPSDRLVINGGTATGNSFLAIANTTGPGALTVADGILVVDAQNGGTTVPGAFALANRVAAGAFEYSLYRGGTSNGESWFLRSRIVPTPPGPVPPGPVPPGPVPPPIPDYRNEVPVDIVLPALANRLGLGTLGTYHDRIGDDYPAPVQPVEPIICKAPSKDGGCAVPAAVAAEMQPTRAAWGRLFGETGSVDFDATNPAGAVQNIVEHGPSYDFDMYGLQAGMDLLRRLNEDGSRDIAGFYIGVGRITADVDAVLGGPAGTSSVNGYSLGGYWTRIAEKGWYLDAVLQATWYDAEGNAQGRGRFAGESFDTDGWGFAASLEGGYPFDLGNGWSVEPQAQLVYQHVSLDDGSDAFARIDYDATDALYGRLGGRLTKDWLTQSGKRMTAWGKADVWSGFGASATTTFSGPAGGNPISFDTDIGGTWGSVGLGLQGEVKKNVTMFASGDYNFGLGGDGDFDSWSGRIGMKVKW